MSVDETMEEHFFEKNAVYERPDTDAGFITDSTEIMQQKAVRMSDIINSQLLGDFDEYGVYSIDKNVVIQLVRLRKRITHQNDYGTFAVQTVQNKTFHFRMTPTKIVEGKMVAQLELLEEVYRANGYIIDTRTTLLATYALEPVSNFEELARNMFHISSHPEDDDFGGDEGEGNGALTPEEAEYIKHRLAYLQAMDLVSVGLYEKLEEAYFNKRIKILNNIPEATIVLAEYKKQFAKVEHFFVNNSKRKYRAMNDILTSVIEGPKGEKIRYNAEYREKMKDVNRIYLKTVMQIDESVKKSMEVIDAVAKSMPIEETKEMQPNNLVVAIKKEQQKSNERRSVNTKSSAAKVIKKSGGDKNKQKKKGGSGDKNKPKKKEESNKGKNEKKKPTYFVDIEKLVAEAQNNSSKQTEKPVNLSGFLNSAEGSDKLSNFEGQTEEMSGPRLR